MQNSTRRILRTVVQTVVALGTALPMLLAADGVAEALPWLGQVAAVAGGLAKLMAVPAVQRLLPRWLQVPLDPDDELAALARRDPS